MPKINQISGLYLKARFTLAQATGRQIRGTKFKNIFRIDENFLVFFPPQCCRVMMGNLSGFAKYLLKYSRAKVHNFPTIMLCTVFRHISCQPEDFFRTDPGKDPLAIPPCPQIVPTTLVRPVKPIPLNLI